VERGVTGARPHGDSGERHVQGERRTATPGRALSLLEPGGGATASVPRSISAMEMRGRRPTFVVQVRPSRIMSGSVELRLTPTNQAAAAIDKVLG